MHSGYTESKLKNKIQTLLPYSTEFTLKRNPEPATNIFSSPSPPSTATKKKECKSEGRSVYSNLIVSFMNSEAFNNQTVLSRCSVDANVQTAKCSFNVKFKTQNYIPLSQQSIPRVHFSITF